MKYASKFLNVKFYVALNEIGVKLKSPKLYSASSEAMIPILKEIR
jgi:hypothetical protein